MDGARVAESECRQQDRSRDSRRDAVPRVTRPAGATASAVMGFAPKP
jgi:hypothetical protein